MPVAGDPLLQHIGDRWAESGVGTNAGVTVTHPASSTFSHLVTGIQVSGDGAALVTIESPASTVIWRQRYTGAFDRSYTFILGALQGAFSQAVLVKISASTAACEANIQGFSVPTGTLADLAKVAAMGAILSD